MKEPRKVKLARERKIIVRLHDKENYSFAEIGKMPEFKTTPQAIFQRYKRATTLDKPLT